MTLERLAAREAIKDALGRYCHGVDRGDRDMILSAFHPDAHLDYGSIKGAPVEFADDIIKMFDDAPVGQHHITNVLFEINGDRAQVISYFLALNPQGPKDSGGHDLVGGRYLDAFECRDGEWRIVDRIVVLDVTRDELAGTPWPSGSLAEGARHQDDPSVAFLAGAS